MKSLASWCVRHRVVVLLLWLVALLGTGFLSQSIGTAYSNSFSLPNTESTQALSLLQSAAPNVAGDREQIVFHTTNGAKVTDPAVEASVTTASTHPSTRASKVSRRASAAFCSGVSSGSNIPCLLYTSPSPRD